MDIFYTINALVNTLVKDEEVSDDPVFKIEDILKLCSIHTYTFTEYGGGIYYKGNYRSFIHEIINDKVDPVLVDAFNRYAKNVGFGYDPFKSPDPFYDVYVIDMYLLDNIDYDINRYIDSSLGEYNEEDEYSEPYYEE